jgi:transposase
MAYKHSERNQAVFFPKTIDECVTDDAPVRAYAAFIKAIDLTCIGMIYDPDKVGNSSYDPKTMLTLLAYGYSYGIRSSRKLERACHDILPFIWIMGDLKPDHKTIAEFRRKNRNSIKKIIKLCARMCVEMDLIDGNVLFVDGSRFRANASVQNSWTKKKAMKALEEIDERIERLLNECEVVDEDEKDMGSLVKMSEELKDKKVLRERIEGILEKISKEDRPSLNTTDKDCVRTHSRQGSHAGYNGQIVVDDKNGLIVNGDVVDTNCDYGHFTSQLQQAQVVVDGKCRTAVADAGYAEYEDISELDGGKIDVIIPSMSQASGKEKRQFDVSVFQYDKQNDYYICPTGKILKYDSYDSSKKRRRYTAGKICVDCEYFGICTKCKTGRKISRNDYEELRRKLEKRYQEPDAKEIYSKRKEKVEHPFGHIKRNLGFGHFLLRGLEGVRAEWSLIACVFNITRMIKISGVKTLIAKMRSPG